MVKLKYIRVLVERNERLSHPVTVAPWEIPVLQEVHAGSLFTELGTRIVTRDHMPTGRDEFERLKNRYKNDGESEVPFVSRVYGVGQIAVENLERQIQSAIVSEQGSGAAVADPEDAVDPATLDFLTGGAAEEGPQEITA